MNPIVTALADVAVGLEASFERLSVVPLLQRSPAPPASCITLDEALARGDVEVTEVSEAGHVPELRVINAGNAPVLLLDGEELVGAKQNRIVNLTILVPARANVPIPVSCVESGRWHRRSRGFSSSGNAQYSRARARKVSQVTQSLASTGEARSDQQWIWEDIALKASRLDAGCDTSAMSSMFDAHHRAIGAYVNAFPCIERQCGAVFLDEGVPVGLELFESDVTFRSLFPKLLRSYGLDALDTGDAYAPRHLGLLDPRDAARAFVSRLANAASTNVQAFPTVGLGETLRVDEGRMAAAALVAGERVVHLAAFELGV
jgi:hypothetical protein